jgi:hypothetical protein
MINWRKIRMSHATLEKQPDEHYLLTNLLSEQYQQEELVAYLRREFALNDYVKMSNLINAAAFYLLREEIHRLQQFAKMRSFIMDGYETPRLMSTLGGRKIVEESHMLGILYPHYELIDLLRKIIGEEVYPCLHPNEIMVANFLLSLGATHGWHLDDPAYALILIFEAPSEMDGGLLEFIPGWRKLCSSQGRSHEEKVAPLVEHSRGANLVQVRHHVSGDAYLLRADQCLHQVTALSAKGVSRIALNLAYEATRNPRYGRTANMLYGQD